MSRRNQSRRRRTYGRRQHEVRERRIDDPRADTGFLGDADATMDSDWNALDALDERTSYTDSFGGFSR